MSNNNSLNTSDIHNILQENEITTEEDDEILIKFFEKDSIKYALYIRYDGSGWPPTFIVNLNTKTSKELDHGLKGGPSDVKFEDDLTWETAWTRTR